MLNSQKGISLYISLVILSVVLAIVLGLSAILIREIKITRKIGYSVVALFAADTGIEKALDHFYSSYPSISSSIDGELDSIMGDNPGYRVYIFCGSSLEADDCPGLPQDDCDAYFCIKSHGSYKGVTRAIETKIGD